MKDADFVRIVWDSSLRAGQFAEDELGDYALVPRELWQKMMGVLESALAQEHMTREWRRFKHPNAHEEEAPKEAGLRP